MLVEFHRGHPRDSINKSLQTQMYGSCCDSDATFARLRNWANYWPRGKPHARLLHLNRSRRSSWAILGLLCSSWGLILTAGCWWRANIPSLPLLLVQPQDMQMYFHAYEHNWERVERLRAHMVALAGFITSPIVFNCALGSAHGEYCLQGNLPEREAQTARLCGIILR